METKAFPMFMKAIENRVVKSLFAVMGSVDDGNDRLWPGAFAKTLKESPSRVKVLWQHDHYEPPIGVPLVLQEIGKAELPGDLLAAYPDANGGLYGEIEYLDTPRGNEILTGIRAGAITENSFAYMSSQFDYTVEGGKQVRNLREVQLMDVSPVLWGMQPATMNLKVARQQAELRARLAALAVPLARQRFFLLGETLREATARQRLSMLGAKLRSAQWRAPR